MNGILLIDKPKGWTSHDVVAKVRSLLRHGQVESRKSQVKSQKVDLHSTLNIKHSTPSPKVKVGHAGTLDPMATGLLIVLIGNATKRQDEFMKQDKVYSGTITLGASSNTDDAEGEIKEVSDKVPKLTEINKALISLKGEIMQVPPVFSAIKKEGKRSYAQARKGLEVKLDPRPVTIFSFELISYSYPKVEFKAHVSSGTYIRSLARDLGQHLGTGAYLSALKRESIGKYELDDAIDGGQLSMKEIAKAIKTVL